LSYIPI